MSSLRIHIQGLCLTIYVATKLHSIYKIVLYIFSLRQQQWTVVLLLYIMLTYDQFLSSAKTII